MTRVFTTGQVARIFSVNINTVIKWFDENKLKGFRLPRSNERRIYRESVIEFMKEHEISTDLLRMFDEEEHNKRRARRTSRPPSSKRAVDLRSFPRRDVDLPATLEKPDGAVVEVKVGNLSMGGAFITGYPGEDRMLPTEFTLRIDIGAIGRTLDGVCQLVHMRRTNDDAMAFGCRFTQVDPGALQAYIASL